MLKITLDTNCIINLRDSASSTATSIDELQGLMRFSHSGRVEIAITTRVEADLRQDKNPERRAAFFRQLGEFPTVASIQRWDFSSWDNGDGWTSESAARLQEDLTMLLFPGLQKSEKRYANKINDIDHLVGHLINKRDIFVTDDRGILKKAGALKASPGIVVMSPGECIAYLEAEDLRNRRLLLQPNGPNPEYHSRELSGHVAFDYSNNNHRYAIGDGHFLFETRWSKASDKSIHAYTDSPSIAGVALARSASEISDIRDASTLDYSSRVRTVGTGQIAVWQNVNGLYAATKVVLIKDDTRGAAADELAFDYVILSSGSADFGDPA